MSCSIQSATVTILAEQAWHYVAFMQGSEGLFTVLLGGVAEIAVSIRLTSDEITQLRTNPDYANELLKAIKSQRSKFADREIHPAIWPAKPGDQSSDTKHHRC